jgi:hypothetical protein
MAATEQRQSPGIGGGQKVGEKEQIAGLKPSDPPATAPDGLQEPGNGPNQARRKRPPRSA